MTSHTADETHELRTDRMLEYGLGQGSTEDIWGVGYSHDMIGEGTSEESEPYHTGSTEWPEARSAQWHAARIRYLLRHPEELEQPIEVDCECYNDRVFPIPDIRDGWHRYYAHLHRKRTTINATFSGLVTLLEYLTGESDKAPE